MNPSEELLNRCCNDDRRAHAELYNMCFGFLVSVCRRYYVNREDVASALNMIFLKMIKGMMSYMKKSSSVPFDLWSRRIAINYIIDEFRKNKKYRENLDFMLIEEAEQLHPFVNPSLTNERMEEIMEAVNKLPLMSKTVFNLFAVDGYQHNEIAEMLKISVGTSKAHLFNARKKLQEMLGRRKEDQKTYSNVV